MSRTTKREVEAVFARFCEAVGVPQGGEFDRESRTMSRGWALDHAPLYGGWSIVGYGQGTSETHPLGIGSIFGMPRMPAGEFVRAMHFAIRALEHARGEGRES